MDRYAVIGNPIAHSKSPRIHAAFAAQTGQQLSYEALLAPLDGFRAAVAEFRHAGGRGMNVTVPFKLEAHALAERLSPRAEAAGAVNTLAFDGDGIFGDNTDGAGLVRDLTHNLNCPLTERRVLLLGEKPVALTIANRTRSRAEELIARFGPRAGATTLDACGFAELAGRDFDVVINATAASLSDQAPELPSGLYAPDALAYDMMYGRGDTPFMSAARRDGAERTADGLGMLIEQAAESFRLWRGVRPETGPVLEALRTEIMAA